MGKNQSASGLTNVIQYSNGNITFVSGSTTLMSISSSGAITTTGVISGSNALSASYAANADTLDGLDSTVFTLTSSFNAQTASFTAFTASILAQTASLNSFSSSVLTFTGSAATRLGALEAATASLYTTTSSLNSFSASVLTFTGSAATRLGALESYTSSLNNKTSSFATTGSNTFIGTQTISGSVLQSGSFTTTGTIIAQTINVQTVTSSIVYSSGSNIFGNLLGDSQTFTGSVLVTGSLTIAGGSSATSYSGATIYGSTVVCSPVGKFTSCIDVGGAGTFTGALNTTSGTRSIQMVSYAADWNYLKATGANFQIGTTDANNFYIQTNNTDRLTIVSTGAATFSSTITGTTIYGSTAVCSPVGKFTSCIDAGTGTFSGNVTNVSALYVRASGNSDLPFINFSNADGVYNWGRVGGLLQGDGDGSLYFQTKLGGSLGTRLTITSTGASTFSSTITANGGNILSCGASYGIVQVKGSGASTWQMFANPSDEMRFGRSGVGDYLTIANTGAATFSSTIQSGNISIPSSTGESSVYMSNASADLAVAAYSSSYGAVANYAGKSVIQAGNAGSGTGQLLLASWETGGIMTFYTGGRTSGCERMRITSGGITCFSGTVCAPCFATISDYRMKSNVRPIEGLSIIMNTKPYKFEYNYDCSTSFGMIAHELQDTVPEAVFGEKDGEVMQGVDYMKLLPITIKAIQEQQCTICTQTSRITLLESCLGIA